MQTDSFGHWKVSAWKNPFQVEDFPWIPVSGIQGSLDWDFGLDIIFVLYDFIS